MSQEHCQYNKQKITILTDARDEWITRRLKEKLEAFPQAANRVVFADVEDFLQAEIEPDIVSQSQGNKVSENLIIHTHGFAAARNTLSERHYISGGNGIVLTHSVLYWVLYKNHCRFKKVYINACQAGAIVSRLQPLLEILSWAKHLLDFKGGVAARSHLMKDKFYKHYIRVLGFSLAGVEDFIDRSVEVFKDVQIYIGSGSKYGASNAMTNDMVLKLVEKTEYNLDYGPQNLLIEAGLAYPNTTCLVVIGKDLQLHILKFRPDIQRLLQRNTISSLEKFKWVMERGLVPLVFSNMLFPGDMTRKLPWHNLDNQEHRKIYETLRKMLVNALKDQDENWKKNYLNACLLWCCGSSLKKTVFVRRLLTIPTININAQDSYGFTPLINAVLLSSGNIVDLLLKKGADVHKVNKAGYMALTSAIQKGDEEIINILLQHPELKIDKKGWESGSTALMFAVQQGRNPIIKLLLDRGANPDKRNNRGLQAADFTRDNVIKEMLRKAAKECRAHKKTPFEKRCFS